MHHFGRSFQRLNWNYTDCLCQLLLQSVPAALQQVVFYRLVTGHTCISWRHLVFYLTVLQGSILLGFRLAGLQLLGSFIQSDEDVPLLVVPRFLMGWLDSLGQFLQLCQGLFPWYHHSKGLASVHCLASVSGSPACQHPGSGPVSALISAGTSMLLTGSIFLDSSVSGVICPLQLSSSGMLDSSELS